MFRTCCARTVISFIYKLSPRVHARRSLRSAEFPSVIICIIFVLRNPERMQQHCRDPRYARARGLPNNNGVCKLVAEE